MPSLQEKIKEFADISGSIAENLQVTCFQMLLTEYLTSAALEKAPTSREILSVENHGLSPAAVGQEKATESLDKPNGQADVTLADLHMKTRKFMDRYSVSIGELNNLFYKDGAAILPLYEDLKTVRMSEAQIRITLLQSLHSALGDGEFTSKVDDIRAACRDRKVLDAGNFTKIFKNNSSLFDFDNYDKDTTSLRLSEIGRKELAEIIKELQ